MMTLDEIHAAKINPNVAREAYNQAEKRLSDTIEIKKSFKQKAFTLFSGYITASIALFGVGGALLRDDSTRFFVRPFFVTGLIIAVGAICFVLALMDKVYGALVRLPHKPNGVPAHAVISGNNGQSFNLSNAAPLLGCCNL
jgi:hypothetical protein